MTEEQKKDRGTLPPGAATPGPAGIERNVLTPRMAKPKRGKRLLRFLRGVVLYVLFVLVLVVLLPKGLSWWLKTDYPMAAITSASMWPALKQGDLILVAAVKPEELKTGDIVVYSNPRGFTIHRITEIDRETGEVTTKGDANNVSDKPVPISDVFGRALAWGSGKPVRIPKLGFISILVAKKVSQQQ